MRCKAEVDAACAASVRESLRERRDAKWEVVEWTSQSAGTRKSGARFVRLKNH